MNYNQDHLRELVKVIVDHGGYGDGPSPKNPDQLIIDDNLAVDFMDVQGEYRFQKKFRDANCSHIHCGDTDKSCVLMNLIIRLCKPRVLVEIGRYCGYSTSQIAYGVMKNKEDGYEARFVSIDPAKGAPGGEGWVGDQCGDPVRNQQAKDDLHKAELLDYIEIVDAYSQDYVDKAPDDIEFLFIDGDHRYQQCLADLNNYGNKMTPGGVCVLHDVWNVDNPEGTTISWGPAKVYKEADSSMWEKLGGAWYTGVLLRK